MKSPIFRTITFWATFYGAYHYARRDEVSGQHVYPSYVILKQKIISDTWSKGIDG